MPAILRSIYAYHVKSRGWSDIGYNFLVDRFGRIWEGRYGGIDKPVVGAHTLNYNDYSFAMSAIGNFDTVQPPDVMLRAYGQLFAWKLSLHGVNPASTSQKIGRGTFQAINGHRDAGSTACPGKYLYAQLPLIRTYASQAAPVVTPPPPPTEVPIAEPAPQNNLDASPYPDLVVRRAADGRGLVLPTGGLTSFQTRTVVGKKGWDKRAEVLVSPDLTGDGLPDLVTADKSGVVRVRAGKGNGKFGKTTRTLKLRGYSLITAVGDINGDGRNDLVARFKGRLTTLLATEKGGFARKVTRKGYGNYRQIIGAGDVNGDGRADLLLRTKNRLFLQTGYGTGRFAAPKRVAGSWSGYNRVVAGDFNGDGRSDLVARTSKGNMMLMPGRGDGTYGAALGPATNLKSMRWITGANMVGGAGADLIGVSGKQLVVVANRDTFELGAPIDTGVSFAGMDTHPQRRRRQPRRLRRRAHPRRLGPAVALRRQRHRRARRRHRPRPGLGHGPGTQGGRRRDRRRPARPHRDAGRRLADGLARQRLRLQRGRRSSRAARCPPGPGCRRTSPASTGCSGSRP